MEPAYNAQLWEYPPQVVYTSELLNTLSPLSVAGELNCSLECYSRNRQF